MHKKGDYKDRTFHFINYMLLCLFSLAIIYPFYYLLINSFNGLLSHGPAYLFPSSFTFNNYRIVFTDQRLVNAFVITILRTVAGIVVAVFNCAMCAFALRKRKLSLRNLYLVIFTIPMFFNGGVIPIYLNIKMLGLLDNFLVYIIPHAFSFFYVIIFMSCFNDLPDSLEESATIDGAGSLMIFIKIFLPVSLPVMATMSLFAGVAQWNSWFDTLFYTNSPGLMTMSAVLMKIVRENNLTEFVGEMAKDMEKNRMNPEGVKFATMFVTILPITILYPFLQKYFIKGIMVGSVKG